MKLSVLLLNVAELDAQCLRGDDVLIFTFAELESATQGNIAFVSNPKFLPLLKSTQASAVVVTTSMWAAHANEIDAPGVITCSNPYAFFAYASQVLERHKVVAAPAVIHETAVLDPTARVAQNVNIGAYATVAAGAVVENGCFIGSHCAVGENAHISQNTYLYPHVTVYHDVQIGENCIIHAGSVIGSDGFGFAPHNKRWIKIPQTGRVIIGDDVEIGSNCSIDRGALGDTTIGRGTKLDNLIQIAHNVQIGEDCAFAANIAIAGSAVLGNRIQIGGNAGVLGHLSVCDDVVISSCTLVTKTINKPGFYSGVYPIQENGEWEKNAVVLKRLAKMREQVRELEKQVKGSS